MTLLGSSVNLGDIAARKGNYCRLTAICGVWVDEDGRARGLRLADRIGEISHLIAAYFASIWIRQLFPSVTSTAIFPNVESIRTRR